MTPSAPAAGAPAGPPDEASPDAAEEPQVIGLTEADSRAFAEALLSPREPSPRLRTAAERAAPKGRRALRKAAAEARAAFADLSPEEVEALVDEAVAWARSGGGARG